MIAMLYIFLKTSSGAGFGSRSGSMSYTREGSSPMDMKSDANLDRADVLKVSYGGGDSVSYQ